MASGKDNKGEVNIVAGHARTIHDKVDRAHLSADHYKVEAQLKAVPVGQLLGPKDSQARLPAISQSFDTLPLAVDIERWGARAGTSGVLWSRFGPRVQLAPVTVNDQPVGLV